MRVLGTILLLLGMEAVLFAVGLAALAGVEGSGLEPAVRVLAAIASFGLTLLILEWRHG